MPKRSWVPGREGTGEGAATDVELGFEGLGSGFRVSDLRFWMVWHVHCSPSSKKGGFRVQGLGLGLSDCLTDGVWDEGFTAYPEIPKLVLNPSCLSKSAALYRTALASREIWGQTCNLIPKSDKPESQMLTA